MNIGSILESASLISAVLAMLLILLQQRGAGFGASGELYTTRRGLEKSLFNATVVLVVMFVASILGMLLLPTIS